MVKKIISYIIIVILIILLFASNTITILSQTILNEKFVLGLLEKNDYYAQVYSQILETFKDNTIQSGLEESILDGIMTEEQVKNDAKSFLDYLYNGTELTIDTEGVKTRLQEKINEVIKENNKRVNSDEQAAINTYINTIGSIYENGITFMKKYVSQVQSAITKIQEMLQKVTIVVYVATIVIILIIFIINKREGFKYLAVSSFAAAGLCIALKIVENSTMRVQNILIFSKAFSVVLINAIESIMLSFVIASIVFCVLGLLFSILGYKKTAKREKE